MKNLINRYILSYFRPKYKRLAPKLKSIYNKFTDWRYGIKCETKIIEQKECCDGNCKCKSSEGENV